jgi:hypothetical protein
MKKPDLITDVLGISLRPERVEENLNAYADILEEIAKLRTLDLSDVHPAVIFSPIVVSKDKDNE